MTVRLLHYSDLENAYDDPERIGRLAGSIGRLRDDDALVVGTGDDTAPGVLSLVSEGRQSLDFFSRVEPDFETFGNHDFDHGLDAIRRIVRDSPGSWVATNVYRGDGRFGAAEGVVPTAVREVGGERIGVFGVLDPVTPEVTPGAGDLRVTDPVEAAREAVADLRSRGVDHVIALSHCGRGDDDIARGTDVDVILGGHVHAERVDRIDGTLLTRPGPNGGALLEVEYDGGWDVRRHETAEGPIDDGVADALRRRRAAADLDETVATVAEPMGRAREATFGGETRLGRAVADAYRWATGADVGLQNSGGIREGPSLDGAVTAADLIGVVPFDEPVTVAELTGDELLRVLRQTRGHAVEIGEPDWWLGHTSGAEVEWNGTTLATARVGDEPIDPDATYTLATSDFLFGTPYEFPALGVSHRVESTGRRQYEILVDYAREVGLDGAVEVGGRSR